MPPVVTEVAFTTDPGATSPSWTDISAYVKSSSPTRGRDSEFDDFGPGTNSLRLNNKDRRFDPSYTAGPYYGYLLPMRRVRQYVDGPLTGLEWWSENEVGDEREWT